MFWVHRKFTPSPYLKRKETLVEITKCLTTASVMWRVTFGGRANIERRATIPWRKSVSKMSGLACDVSWYLDMSSGWKIIGVRLYQLSPINSSHVCKTAKSHFYTAHLLVRIISTPEK